MRWRMPDMRRANFTEVRNHAKTFFDIVESGEVVRVLRDSKAARERVVERYDLTTRCLPAQLEWVERVRG